MPASVAAGTSVVVTGRYGSRESGNAASAFGPVVPPAITRRPPPATQPRSASSWAGLRRSASMSCQTTRSMALQASTRSGRSSGVTLMTSGATWF